MTQTTQAELANVAAREGMYTPRVAASLRTIPDVMDVDLRINIRGALKPGPGLFGDGSIGATAIRTGSTLITADADFARVVILMGGRARLF